MDEQTSKRVARLAAQGMKKPMSLTPEEIQAICASALTQAADQCPEPDVSIPVVAGGSPK